MSKAGKFAAGFMIGAAAGAAAATALHKKKPQIKAKMMELKMRADIDRRVRALQKFSREAYNDIVEEVLEGYEEQGALTNAQLELLEARLKKAWRDAKGKFQDLSEELSEDD